MMDFTGDGDPYHLLLTEPILSIVDNSLHHSKYLLAPGTVALRHCFAKLACWFSSVAAPAASFRHLKLTIPSPKCNLFPVATPSCFAFPHASFIALFGHRISNFSLKSFLTAAADNIQPVPLLSLAAVFVPPFDHLNTSMPAIPSEVTDVQMLGSLDKSPCNVHHQGCVGHAFSELNCVRHTVEPKTGIEFPGVLNSLLAKDKKSNLSSEVLVGTGSRIMTIIKIKSLKVYAFGFYVHQSSVCQKLGSKYGSVPVVELKERNDFYADLLREDIGMTLRLVVNYSGMKIDTVKDAFEKSLRARLAKTNPETDFKCITTFGSYFTKDIPLPVGTVIDVRRTPDGQLITEIGGNQIGVVRSRELCRAFFDMYIGEAPVSKQTKEEIGTNVASILGRC